VNSNKIWTSYEDIVQVLEGRLVSFPPVF